MSIVERGESFYQDKMTNIVEELTNRGVLEEDDGRKIMWANKIEVIIINENLYLKLAFSKKILECNQINLFRLLNLRFH